MDNKPLMLLRVCGFVYVVGHAVFSFSKLNSSEHTSYKTFGRLLRVPIFLIVSYFWALVMFPALLFASIFVAVLQIVLYPLILATAFLLGAFAGMSEPPNLQKYWHDFPDRYYRWLRFGTVILEAWTIGERSK
jgi:hypothetical protein